MKATLRLLVAVAAAIPLAGPVLAMGLVCPIEPDCVDLMPGEVAIQPMYAGQTVCVTAQSVESTYTLVPINPSLTEPMSVGITVSGTTDGSLVPVAEPQAAGAMLLAPLQDMNHESAGQAGEVSDELAALFAPERRSEVLLTARSRVGSGVPALGDLLQIQVEPGCDGPLDMRTGRVEAISTDAGSKIYMVQEVFETSPGVWEPAVSGGFTPEAFAALADAYVLAPPGSVSADTLSTLRTGARDLLQSNFGAHLDLDANGGVVVFFTRRINEAAPPGTPLSVVARFDARDLVSAVECPRSNEGEIIYALMPDPMGQVNGNIRPLISVFGQSTPALVHQMVRLTNAQRRLYVTEAPSLELPWLDVSLAWVAQELVFYNVSMGLTPMSNITLSDLTSGPHAATRVSAFNAWQNPQFGALSMHMLQSPTGAPQGSFGALQANPPPNADELPTEQIRRYFGATAAFLRYAMDRHPDTDANLLQALVDSQQTGIQNLEAVFGANLRHWLHDFGVALFADDTALVVDDVYRTQSWNFRSVYGGLGGFPLQTFPFVDGVTQSFTLGSGGGQRWHTFGVSANGPAALLQLDVDASAPMGPLRIAIVRTQ